MPPAAEAEAICLRERPGCGSRLYVIRAWARSASCEISKALTKSFNVIGQLS